MTHPTDFQIETAIKTLKLVIDAAENSNHSGEVALMKAAKALEKNSVWQDISTAPKDGSSFLCRVGSWMNVCHWNRTANAWCNNGPNYSLFPADEQPTHWMSLPDVPVQS